jgi:hypothetical protein
MAGQPGELGRRVSGHTPERLGGSFANPPGQSGIQQRVEHMNPAPYGLGRSETLGGTLANPPGQSGIQQRVEHLNPMHTPLSKDRLSGAVGGRGGKIDASGKLKVHVTADPSLNVSTRASTSHVWRHTEVSRSKQMPKADHPQQKSSHRENPADRAFG